MASANPRIVVLGGAIPESLRAQLDGNIDLVGESELDAGEWVGVLVHARPESLSAVRRFRNAGGLLPIYGVAEGAVDVAQRIQWIREGADDLLSLKHAADVLSRRIRGLAVRHPTAAPSVPTGVRIDRYLVAISRYLKAREDVLVLLGPDGRQKFLDCHFLRDSVLRAADGEFPDLTNAQRRGSEREPLQWGVRVAGEPAELQNIGADGIGLLLTTPLEPQQHVQVVIDGYAASAQLMVEVRWQRRAARERWEVGAYATTITMVREPA